MEASAMPEPPTALPGRLYLRISGEQVISEAELKEGDSVQSVLQRTVSERAINDIGWIDVERWQLREHKEADARLIASGTSGNPTRLLQLFTADYVTHPNCSGRFPEDTYLTITRGQPSSAAAASSSSPLQAAQAAAATSPGRKRQKLEPGPIFASMLSTQPDVGRPSVSASGALTGPALSSPLFLRREGRYIQLLKALVQHRVVLVRSPPLTGKTSMCSEMAKYVVEEKGCDAYSVSLLDWDPVKEDYDAFFSRKVQVSLQQLLTTPPDASASDVVLIIDGFHKMYQLPLWNLIWALLKMHMIDSNREATHLYVLLFAAYAQHEESATPAPSSSSSQLYPSRGTTSMIHSEIRVDFLYLFDATFLAFTETEFKSIVASYNSKAREAEMVPLDDTVSTFLFSFTRGHVGFTIESIYQIVRTFWDAQRRVAVTTEEIIDYLYGPHYLSSMMTLRRAIAMPSKWSAPQLEVVQEALSSVDYSCEIPLGSNEHRSLIRLGLMYLSTGHVPVRFPSPLHRLIISYNLHKTGRTFAPNEFDEFLETVISHMDFELIGRWLSRHSATSSVDERQFQVEFNKAAMAISSGAHRCFPDVGYSCKAKGFLDFYLNALCWGVEVARDCHGEDLEEHVGRFSPPTGKYCRIPLKAKVVLNFVTAAHYAEHPAVLDLEWKVVYEPKNFHTVKLVRMRAGTKQEMRIDLIQTVSRAAQHAA